jgi:hypothetical protein
MAGVADRFMAWVRSIGTIADPVAETGASVAPWTRDKHAYLTPEKALLRLSAFSAETIARLRAEEEARTGRPANNVPARVNLILCHNNAILQRFQAAGMPGHYEHRSNFQNAFITGHRAIADLREAEFASDDDSAYCMTYGRCFKIISQIHADIARRAGQGQPLRGARICIATHITLLDSWHPSTDLTMLLYLIGELRSYGCAIPRLVHLSQGPRLSIAGVPAQIFGSSSDNLPGQSRAPPLISLHWNAERAQSHGPRGFDLDTDQEVKAEEIKHAINAAATHLQSIAVRTDLTTKYVGAETGFVHIIVPDSVTAANIRKEAGDALIRRGWIFEGAPTDGLRTSLTIRFTQYAQLPQAKFSAPDHVIILPFQRLHQSYTRIAPAQICAIISMLSTYLNSAAMPLCIAVISNAPPEVNSWVDKDPVGLVHLYPIDPNVAARKFVQTLPMFEQMKYVCRLTEASIQPGRLFPDATLVASQRALVRTKLAGDQSMADRVNGPEVVQLTSAGVFASRANLPPAVAKFIDQWQRTPYPPFPAYCLAAILERSISHASPLLSADSETLARIAKDNGYPDPLTHMLSPIADYVRKYGITLIGDSEMGDFASSYGADPSAFAEVLIRILSLRHAGISSNDTYGPFRPESLVKILKENLIFPVADFVAGNERTTYTIPGSKTLHVIPQDCPYPIQPAVLIFHVEEERQTNAYARNALPTAIIKIHANIAR